MKRLFLIGMILLAALPMLAQVDGESYRKAKQRYVGVGVKAGVFLPGYNYGLGSDLNRLPKDDVILNLIRPMAGALVEIPVGNNAYFAPELIWIQKGDSRHFKNVPLNDSIRYTAIVNYLDLRLPVEVLIPVGNKFQPYLFGGVDIGVVMPYIDTLPLVKKPLNLSGVIIEETSANITEVDVNKSNMSPLDFGVFAGAGLRYTIDFDRFSMVLKFQAAYTMGLLNTYSRKEVFSQAPAANLGNGGTHYAVGRRFNRGMECTFSLVIPLHFLGNDACSSFEL